MHIFKNIALENFIQPTEVKGRAPPKTAALSPSAPDVYVSTEAQISQMIYRAACHFPNEASAVGAPANGRPNKLAWPHFQGSRGSIRTNSREGSLSELNVCGTSQALSPGSIRPISHLRLLSAAARETAIIRIISSAWTPVVLMFCKERNWTGALSPPPVPPDPQPTGAGPAERDA